MPFEKFEDVEAIDNERREARTGEHSGEGESIRQPFQMNIVLSCVSPINRQPLTDNERSLTSALLGTPPRSRTLSE